MSREIKFRIYDKKRKSYIGDENGFTLQSLVLAPCDGMVDKIEDYVFEQDTGLKDRHSKRIREGDIVKWTNGLNESMLYEVYFNECRATFLLNPLVDGEMIEGMSDKKKPYIEVIGNIHENKELLRGGK